MTETAGREVCQGSGNRIAFTYQRPRRGKLQCLECYQWVTLVLVHEQRFLARHTRLSSPPPLLPPPLL